MELTPQSELALKRTEKLPLGKLHSVQYVVAAILVILAAGLWRLEVVGADNFRALAEANRVRKVPVLAPRGRLFDREGRLLVDNYPSVSCFILREQIKDLEADMPLISAGLHMTPDQVHAVFKRYQSAPKYQPIPLKQDITPDEQAFIEAHRNELPELETLEEQRRLYPKDGFAAHLIGYVGEISEDDLNKEKYAFYQPGDVVGKSGVEATYDSLLRGVDGSRDIIVNSHGKEIGHLGQTLAEPGKDLKLTIDLDIQMAAERAMEGKTGAVIAMDPHTGEILALVSRPTFDPNQFAVRLTRSYWNEIITNPDHPLMNKALQAQLAPGSTFKIIMSYAGLEEGKAQTMHVPCNHGATFYGHYFSCDRNHGMVTIDTAIPYSCDTFYYTLADRLGIDTIARYATSVGLSQKTGIDLPDEASGNMPSTAWKLKTQHERWYPSEAMSVGIGQGAVTATPIQLARALSGIASGGVLRRPHVVFNEEVPADMLEAIHETFPGSGEKTIPLSTDNWETITNAMYAVTSSPIGTAYAARLEGIDFAGKTGTADIVSGRDKSSKNKATIPNAWFVGMTPRRNPDIVVAVLWEHGYWGNNSARLASGIIDAFVEKQRRRENNIRIAEKPIYHAPVPDAPAAEKPSTPTSSAPQPTARVTPQPAALKSETLSN